MRENLVVYVKPTESCNLNCLHCYNRVGNDSAFLSLERLEKFLGSMSIYYGERDIDLGVEVIIHGGEPMLCEVEFLKDMVNLWKFALPFADLVFSMQSNLVLLNENWVSFIREYLDGIIGTSYSPGLRFVGYDEYAEEIWLKNLDMALHNGLRLYFVVTLGRKFLKEKEPEDLLNFLLRYKAYSFHLEPLTKNGKAEMNWDKISVSPEEYDNWKARFFELFVKEKAYKVIPRPLLVDKAKTFYDGVFVGCSSRDCMKRTLTINADGSVGGCPNVARLYIYGTLDDEFSVVWNSDLRKEMMAKERLKRNECLNCEFISVCNGSCMWLDGCYEGKKFFATVKRLIEEDKDFAEYLKSYERLTVFH